jgi:hypothetical protein
MDPFRQHGRAFGYKKSNELGQAIRKFPIKAAKITFLEDADAMDARLQI